MTTPPDVHPLHSRALTIELTGRADGALDATGVLLDLRKRGLVPVGGDLGTAGIVHHMRVAAVIDPIARRLRTVAAEQPNVAFEPSPLTGGESCRDPAPRLERLAGALLDDGFARRLSLELGGVLGCSHILTLTQLLGSTVPWALDHDGAAPEQAGWRAGERVFRRDLVVDGQRRAGGELEFVVQLTDLWFAPAPAVARPVDRFRTGHELRIWVRATPPGMTLDAVQAVERRRTSPQATAEWRDRSERVAAAVGVPLFRGVSAALRARFGADPADRPLLDALLMIAPTFIQVCAALSDGWLTTAAGTESLVGMGGIPDSCYMWRRGGALDRARRPDDPAPVLE